MPAYNTNFELGIGDLDLIESALLTHQSELSLRRLDLVTDSAEDSPEVAEIDDTLSNLTDLLGRLHNQKVWYRPEDIQGTPYVSG
ncbi:MAG: hypothetical protein OIF47_06540 [Marinibacterium sp.]|nr:hypothetical protein [Marinibacterium sp.]